ncbi:hypothetical protein [Variovorax sp. PAMC26660]|uniref:hypothetical protein n=1 Tax=Variovorax sp. PAMC26660 TaxID=2762322 RepID=UPI00164D7470|nr:hypothetical protein [Variovorax sp. PAMC26660]QNK69198.1 hypothetical protein H7F35_05650 [Variovorax sp. PAMC26660]
MPKTAPTVALPEGVEIFRAGRHTDDSGTTHEFSEADVQRMAAVYDPAKREAPLTVGHPEHNLPAYGWVKGLRAESGRLLMDTHQVEPQFAEMVRAGRFKKRSASFYPPGHPNNPVSGAWYLRHVANLGAQPPAIAGLADIQFSEGEAAGLVQFSEATPSTNQPSQEQDDMSKELQDKLDAVQRERDELKTAREKAERERDEAKTQVTSFAEQQKKDRHATYVSFAETQIKAGKLLPKDKDMAVATQAALADAEAVSFSEGDTTRKVAPLQWLQSLIADAKPVVSFGEFAPGGGGEGAEAGGAKGKSDAEIDKAAQAYMREKKVSYSEAVSHVTSFTS